MRKLGVWSVAASLAVGLAVGRAAAEDGPGRSPPRMWWQQLFGSDPKQDEAARKTEEAAVRARVQHQQAEARRAYADLLRRWAVCDRLAELAAGIGDAAALKHAEELRERAWVVYDKKRGGPVPGRLGNFVAEGFEVGGDLLPRESGTSGKARKEKP